MLLRGHPHAHTDGTLREQEPGNGARVEGESRPHVNTAHTRLPSAGGHGTHSAHLIIFSKGYTGSDPSEPKHELTAGMVVGWTVPGFMCIIHSAGPYLHF